MSEAKRRLAGILVADVVGYSAMMAADEAPTMARVRTLRSDVIEPLAGEHQGRIFKTTGDGFLVAFASAVQALRCAIAIQEKLNAEADGLRLRIGVHQGEVVQEGDDLIGQGVIVASRIEPLADPGGICISGRVREDAAGKVSLAVDDLGTPALKNISQPVQVFRVRLGEVERPALALPDKPSIAVLPFQNMSGDPEQEYFADGMVEELITALSRFHQLFVIARNSSFTYKGRAVDVKQVGRELGVRYVLEGSVRKAGNRVRITGQLIDTSSGVHIWADRFDAALEDVFELQDRVTEAVVKAIEPKILLAEIKRAQSKTSSVQAHDLVLKALPHVYKLSNESIEEAKRLLRRAVEIDPAYGWAFALIAQCCWNEISQSGSPSGHPAIKEAVRMAEIALQHGGDDPEVLAMASFMVGFPAGDLDGGIALAQKALLLNPNSSIALTIMAQLQVALGNPDEAIAFAERAARINPIEGDRYRSFAIAMAHFVAGRLDAALEYTEKLYRNNPSASSPLRLHAAILGLQGQIEEGRRVVAHLLELTPNLTVSGIRSFYEHDLHNSLRTPGVLDRFCEGLRRAGLPE